MGVRLSRALLTPILLAVPLVLGAAVPPPLAIDVNQLGFEPADPKLAILRAGSDVSAWEMLDSSGQVVMRGKTMPYGQDPASGMAVQRIDFSTFRTPGTYRLRTVRGESQAFAIRAGLYVPLARDALAFFYHQRAGVAVEANIVGAKWARPAGHPYEVAKCFTGMDEREILWLGGCPYSLDVTGGWYDAGDHGKYVVNGGIALWTLLAAFERNPDALPGSPNGAPGLLAEARYEMEFLLRMQVPQGTRLSLPSGPFKSIAESRGWRSDPADFARVDASGMAHQKVADARWTVLPTPPQSDTQERLLYPPTTAATLNLAATAAQCARIWKGRDDSFAVRCLSAAERAFAAARRNPQIYATNSFIGSGGYGDDDVSDEFYWAAAELFVTTGKPEYRKALESSPHFTAPAGEPGWPRTATLGTITLATQASALNPAEVRRLRGLITAAADRFLADEAGNGYRIPYLATAYPWGSNGALLNRAMVLGVAGDLTHDPKYRAGVVDALDYVLGRNPNGVSYVSGYGARSMQHPHHRFWAPSLDPKLPGPPPGVLSGGPNSTAMTDPVARKMQGKCAPQTCWADDVNAYALNEVAINWDAPLVWVAAWLGIDQKFLPGTGRGTAAKGGGGGGHLSTSQLLAEGGTPPPSRYAPWSPSPFRGGAYFTPPSAWRSSAPPNSARPRW